MESPRIPGRFKPRLEARLDQLGEGHQLVVLLEREANEGDDVGQHAAGRSVDLCAVERLVGLPQLLGGPTIGRTPDGMCQFLDLFERQPL